MNNVNNNLICRSREQILNNDNINQGKVVQRYNISQAKVESYFIPSRELEAYEIAIFKQDLTAYKKYGTKMKISSITNIRNI